LISNNKKIFLLLLGITLLIPYHTTLAQNQIYGKVMDEHGDPIFGAYVRCYRTRETFNSTTTDANGQFNLTILPSTFSIAVTYDSPETMSPDYYQFKNFIQKYNGTYQEIQLIPSALIYFDGNLRLINLEKNFNFDTIKIINPNTGEPFIIAYYGELVNRFHTNFRELQVPINTSIDLKLEYDYYDRDLRESRQLSFNIVDALNGSLKKGDGLDFSVYNYMDFNYEIFAEYFEEVNNTYNEMDSQGFYLTKQKNSLDSANKYLDDSIQQYSHGAYDNSFTSCKLGYIELEQTQATLISNRLDAQIGIYILVIFFALTSTTIAFFLAEKTFTRVGIGAVFYSFMMTVLYIVYPSTKLLELERYIGAGTISFVSSMGIGLLAPKYLGKGESFDRVPLRSILLDILSIAKRNSHRRKLRFTLTLISITLFIASFVALTSVYEGYGLIVTPVAPAQEKTGILIRPNGYEERVPSPSFFDISEYKSGFLENQSETIKITPKVENSPRLNQLFYLIKENNLVFPIFTIDEFDEYLFRGIQGYIIEGIIGVDPQKEDFFSGLDAALIQGHLPSRKGIIIGNALHEHFGIEIGDTIKITMDEYLTVEGIFDENMLNSITDLDGSTILPDKLVTSIGEGNLVVRVPCVSSNVLIMHYEAALDANCRLNQISVKVDDQYDVNTFAGRLAVERGYWAYASSNNGVFLYRVDKFIEAKGLQLAIPWTIVILNVIITILNSMFERKKEAGILSAIGVNPSQLGFIFVSEAAILGFIGGGMGYLMGLSIYYLMGVLGIALDISPKISAFWSFASIFLSFLSVVVGSVVAFRFSVIFTPSMRRRWVMDGDKDGIYEPVEIPIPISISKSQLRLFVNYFFNELYSLDRQVVKPKIPRVDYRDRYVMIPFRYRIPALISSGSLTINTLVIDQESVPVKIVLESRGDLGFIRETGNLVRKLAMKWSLSQKFKETP